MSKREDDYMRRQAYEHLLAYDVQVVANALGVPVVDLCETAERCDDQAQAKVS